MKVSDVKIGKFYRVKGNNFAYAKVIEILPPNTKENNTRAVIAKCEWVVDKTDTFGLIKYFKVSDLVKEMVGEG